VEGAVKMHISNARIAALFNKLADYMQIREGNPFKIRAYRSAARTIANLDKSLARMVEEGADLSAIPTIGEKIARKIEEIVRTGRLSKLEKIEKCFPPHFSDLLAVDGIGPKRAKLLYEQLRIDSVDALKKAAQEKRIRELKGFDKQLEKRILKGTVLLKQEGKRFLYAEAEPYVKELLAYLKRSKHLSKVSIAGSFRRKKESVGDLDILATSPKPKRIIEHFVRYEDTKAVISEGKTKSTIILSNDLQVDLRCVADESYGAALHYFTGSKSHNIAIRKMALKKGLKVNEYGIFQGKKQIAGRTEEEMYARVGLCYIEPELRENRGELEAAKKRALPKLVREDDIRGDLHMHTTYSDGYHTIKAMAEAAKARGYEYIAVTDHSKHMSIVHGLDEKRLRRQIEEIERINEEIEGITILKSIEADILEDGSLALPGHILRELDLVVVAVHDHFNLSAKRQTQRILKALENPYSTILAHPTGRLIGERMPYDISMEKLFEAVRQHNCFLEINAQPKRLDLNDIHLKAAKEAGVKFAISTDAHNTFSLDYMRYGINQARRGWIEKKDVINTLSLKKLRRVLR
jgi:DNA polymerase (family 10)